VVIASFGVWLARHLLAAMGTPAASLPLAEAYLRVIFLAMPLLYAFAFLSAALRGAGDSKTPFRFLLLAVVLDVVASGRGARLSAVGELDHHHDPGRVDAADQRH